MEIRKVCITKPKNKVIIANGITVNNSIPLISFISLYFSFNSPKKTRWKAHKKYAAFNRIPIVLNTTIALNTGKAPMKHIASLTKPEKPGSPNPAKKANAVIPV